MIRKEYLAYKAYALLTPNSFRVQLLELTLTDSGGAPSRTVLAFIIEDADELGMRIGGVEVKGMLGAPASVYDPEAEITHALFQYLIGNGDWSLLLRRNVKVFKVGDTYIPVGYDFDFTGWVGAPYASANSDIGQTSIYERVYLGYAQTDAAVEPVLAYFKERRREILNMIRTAGLGEADGTTLDRFVTRFFSELNRLRGKPKLTLYDQLRGETASYIPSGEAVEHFRSMGR